MSSSDLNAHCQSNGEIQQEADTPRETGRERIPGAPRAGGVLSNTPPPSSNWVAAEDWFEISFYVNWHPEKWEDLTARLESCKEFAGMRDVPEEITGWSFEGTMISVEPIGSKAGKGRKGIYCTWMFSALDGVRFRLVNRQITHKTMPNVYVTIDGRTCTMYQAVALFEKAKELIGKLGGDVLRNKLSRVDICLDMADIPLDPFVSCFDQGRYICRANARSKYESNGVSVCFGENPIKARIYDKLREVEKQADPLKRLGMMVYRWGMTIPDEATRVEFQIRRDGLKLRGIDTVQDYIDRRASLAQYLTTEWLRLTLDPVDKKNHNQSKARTLPLWTDISAKLIEWGDGADAPLVPLQKGDADVDQLIKQGIGVFKAAARFQGLEHLTDDECLDYMVSHTKTQLTCRTIHKPTD